jgi:hypothetical protein
MSEVVHEEFAQDERECNITRAEIMHVLNDPSSYSQWSVPLAHEQFTSDYDYSLEEWTDDIFAAFRIDPMRWSERIIDPATGRRIDAAEAAGIDASLSDVLRKNTVDYLSRTAVNGYNDGELKITLELAPGLQVDMCGSGEVWVDPSGVSTDIDYSAVFRKVAQT